MIHGENALWHILLHFYDIFLWKLGAYWKINYLETERKFSKLKKKIRLLEFFCFKIHNALNFLTKENLWLCLCEEGTFSRYISNVIKSVTCKPFSKFILCFFSIRLYSQSKKYTCKRNPFKKYLFFILNLN